MRFFRDKVYSFNLVEESYSTSAKRCDEEFNGAQLAIVSSAEEMEFIYSLRSSNDPFWIGASRVFSNPFFWEDGTTLDAYTNWAAGEPVNVATRQGCVSVQGAEGKWVDSKCGTKYFFVCERDPIRKLETRWGEVLEVGWDF